MEAPLVSILIPSYKPEHFEIALTSALAQAYPNTEIIVSDDCPTDDIERICAPYPRVQYSRNPDKGANTNLRRLTRLANGVFLKYLLDDDILHPLCVRRMVDAFGDDQSIKLVFSARDRIDTENRVISRARSVKTAESQVRFSGAVLRRYCVMAMVNMIGEFTTVMFRRSDVHAADGVPIYTTYHGDPVVGLTDIATFLQLCERGDAMYLADALSMFRIHKNANSSSRGSPVYNAGLAEWALFAKHALEDPAFSPADRRETLLKGRERLSSWAIHFPQLATQVDLLGSLLSQLEQAQKLDSGCKDA